MRSNDEIVKILEERTKEKGLSISELARRVGMAKSAISRYFNRTREFPLNKLEDFTKVLDLSPEYVLGLDEFIYKFPTDSEVIEVKGYGMSFGPEQVTNEEIIEMIDYLEPERRYNVINAIRFEYLNQLESEGHEEHYAEEED